MKPGGIVKQKTVGSIAGAASLLMGNWDERLRPTLNTSTFKKLRSLWERTQSRFDLHMRKWSETLVLLLQP
jgi:hypothetical protein